MNSGNENSNLGAGPPAPFSFRQLSVVCTILLVFLASGCHSAGRDSSDIKLTLMDQVWVDKEYQRHLNEQLAEFTRQTGIGVEVLPAPESAVEQLATWRRLLESGRKVPDVYGIDVIWPGILADNLLDLKPYVPVEAIKQYLPELVSNGTVNGRLVSLPTDLNEGMLFYRLVCYESTATVHRRKPGTSLKVWRNGFRLASAPREIKSSGDSFGRGRLPRP